MAEEQLRKAFALMKQGQNKEAMALVQGILKQDKNNAPAWWLMTNLLADDPERRQKALDRVLALDPKHKGALQLQAKLKGEPSPAPSGSSSTNSQANINPALSTQELNLDWSKLEAQEAAKKKREESKSMSEDQAVKIASFVMLGLVAVVAVIAVVFGLIPALQSVGRIPPEQVVRNFYEDFFSGDYETARTLVCADVQEQYNTFVPIFTSLIDARKAALGADAELNFDFSAMTTTLSSSDASNAIVLVGGQITISSPTAPDATQTITIAELEGTDTATENLRLENNQWCISQIQ